MKERNIAALLAALLLMAAGCTATPYTGPEADALPTAAQDLPPAAVETAAPTPAGESTPVPIPEVLDIDGVVVHREDKTLDFTDHDLAAAHTAAEMTALFSQMPNLERVEMRRCGYTNDEMAAMQDALPGVKLVWEIALSHWTIPTDAIAFSTMKTCADTFFLYDDEAKYLKYCTDLVALDLGHNHVTDVSFLQYMPNLKILILVDNGDDEWVHRLSDLSYLQYTPKLEYLEFFVCGVTDLSFLQYTPNLIDLNISYNPVSDATWLFHLPHLERLLLEHTRIPYAQFLKLRQTYPTAQVEYFGEGSIDHGWRTHPRYRAMRDMFENNYVHPYFADGPQRQQPPAWYPPPPTPKPTQEAEEPVLEEGAWEEGLWTEVPAGTEAPPDPAPAEAVPVETPAEVPAEVPPPQSVEEALPPEN